MELLRWFRTWPNDRQNEHDWCVPPERLLHPEDVLRIFKVVGGRQNGMWYWTSSRTMLRDNEALWPFKADGFCITALEARIAAEKAYGALAEISNNVRSA